MQFFPFKPKHTRIPLQIHYRQILEAMATIGRNDAGQRAGRKYAVMNPVTGETFAPKEILRQIIGSDKSFPGGKGFGATNEVFKAFGFPVGRMQDLIKRHADLKKGARGRLRVNELVEKLLSKKWRYLPAKREIKDLDGYGDYPGVYILAYARNLQGKRIREEDIFYVGMAAEGGLGRRLGEFCEGIKTGHTHSAAMRFFRIWLRRRPYAPSGPYRLYFSYLPMECVKEKEWRTPDDLCKLGKVVELEYALMARVKHEIGHEPLLNKK